MRILNTVFHALTLLAVSGICSAASIVSNGDFETGSLSDWTTSGDSTWTNVKSVFPHSPNNEAHIGADGFSGYGYLTQTIATTPGSSYTLSFWYGEYNTNVTDYLDPAHVTTDPKNDYFQDNGLTVQWDGSSVFSDAKFFASDNCAVTQYSGFYKLGTAQVQATGTSTTLSFGAFDRQQDVVLDDIDISVSNTSGDAQAPEPATLGLVGSALIGLGLLRRKNGNSLA